MRSLGTAFGVVVLATCSFGQQASGSGTKSTGSAEQALMQIENELLAALLKGDPSANERYMANNVVLTGPDGVVLDKTRINADLKAGVLKLQSSTISDMKVHVHGDTAVVVYATTDKGTYKGKDISGQYRWTDVFVRRNGDWRLIAGHGSPVHKQ
ncbi:MAG TPA: nuclear transport factor 2 family protein [Bryobacteraceae bacterium]|nr:nuclear transport factor 2 family protein [Bryobacteraceae bacterium]